MFLRRALFMLLFVLALLVTFHAVTNLTFTDIVTYSQKRDTAQAQLHHNRDIHLQLKEAMQP